MAGSGQILGTGPGTEGGADGDYAVVGGYTRGDAFLGFDGNSEGCAVFALVGMGHLGQIQLLSQGVLDAEAHDSAAFSDHHGHDLLGDHLRCDDEIPFVFAIRIIHQDGCSALLECTNGTSYTICTHAVLLLSSGL